MILFFRRLGIFVVGLLRCFTMQRSMDWPSLQIPPIQCLKLSKSHWRDEAISWLEPIKNLRGDFFVVLPYKDTSWWGLLSRYLQWRPCKCLIIIVNLCELKWQLLFGNSCFSQSAPGTQRKFWKQVLCELCALCEQPNTFTLEQRHRIFFHLQNGPYSQRRQEK